MGSGATATQSKRTPQRANDAHQTPFDDKDQSRVPIEYRAAGGWEALPRAIRHLYGDKMPSGFAWAVLVFLNAAQLRNWRNGNTYDDIPAKAWSDGRKHRLATEALSIGEIKDSVDCSARTVEYAIADMVERGVLAKRKVGKSNQYALRFDAWDQVGPPVDAAVDPEDDDEQDDEETPRAPTDQPFRVSGSVAIKLPRVSTFGLAENVAQQFELTSIIVAGEHRIVEIRAIEASTKPATDCGNTPPNPLNSLETKIASAPADYVERASGPANLKPWKDTVTDLAMSLCSEPAGPRLVSRVATVCARVDASPLEFLAYVDTRRATAAGARDLRKYGAAILAHWAEDMAAVRRNERLKAWQARADEERGASARDAERLDLAKRIASRWADVDDFERDFVRQYFPELVPGAKGGDC